MQDNALLFHTLLPVPPSTNSLFLGTGKRRIKTPAYRSWLQAGSLMISASKSKQQFRSLAPIAEPCILNMAVDRPNRMRDLDNTLKSAIDLLVARDILKDDNVIQAIHVYWRSAFPATHAEITIYSADADLDICWRGGNPSIIQQKKETEEHGN